MFDFGYSEKQLLHLVLEFLHLTGDGSIILGQNGGSNDVSGDTTGSAEVRLFAYIDVRHVLVLAEEWKVENNL